MGHLPSLTEPWEPSTRVFVYSVGTADGPDESVRDAFVLDEGPYPERDALRAVLRDLEQRIERCHLPWERREVPRDQVPADLPDWAVYRDRLVNGVREYFALLLPGGTPENPSGILRRVTGPSMSWGQSLGRDGTWRPTEYFHELDRLHSAVGDAVPIPVERAREIVARWQTAGLVPEVDFETARFQAGRPEYFDAPEPPATPTVSSAQYYAFVATSPAGQTVDDPTTIFRRRYLDDGSTLDDYFTAAGTWEQDDNWRTLRQGTSGDAVEITPYMASAIIHRWYEDGSRPRVPDVDVPPLAEPDPAPPGTEVKYYSHLSQYRLDETVDNPSTIYRRTFRPGQIPKDESFTRHGTWGKNEYWYKLRYRGDADGDVVEISPEQASAIIHRWWEDGSRPRVRGVDVPPLATAPFTRIIKPASSNVRYYSHIADNAPNRSVDNPTTIFRRKYLDSGASWDEYFSAEGTWEKHKYWSELENLRSRFKGTVAISPQQASAIIHRWWEGGSRPRVEGVDVPPLSADEASGSVSPATVVVSPAMASASESASGLGSVPGSVPGGSDGSAAQPVFRRTKLFDGIDQATGRPIVNRSQLPAEEVQRVLAYLSAGAIVMSAQTLSKDLFFPDDPPQVPVAFETDGVWIWGGGVRYYLERYGLPPEPDFLAHIRANVYVAPEVSPEVRAAAREAFLAQSAQASAAVDGASGASGTGAPSEPKRVPIQYYARTAPGRPAQDPVEILYTITGRGDLVEQVMGRDGTWHDTDVFARLRESGEQDDSLVEIRPTEAAVVLYRWRETGVIPLVEGVLFPALPLVDDPGPEPGSGSVDAATAQAIGDTWVNASGFSTDRIRAGLYEFDLGYIVYPLAPAASGQAVGAGRGVIDRRTGRLSLWPGYPFAQVAEMYRNSLRESGGRGTD